ncbi:MBL fold hydrolase, partial [Oleiphilus sp. HI0118]
MNILHHGAVNGVTGSCHELRYGTADENGILIDCGLFQGAELSGSGDAHAEQLQIDFPISHIKALVVTHVHIDHVGRIPYLLAAGFDGLIICTEPSAHLLPLVLEDAVKIGFTRNKRMIEQFMRVLKERIVALPYKKWHMLDDADSGGVQIKFKQAGHILGSAYVECRLKQQGQRSYKKVIFSGDLGAPYSPLLNAPKAPYACDTLVIESTYGDKEHEHRRDRKARLQALIERAVKDRGVVLIPAFSIGRTQELLYELENIIHACRKKAASNERSRVGARDDEHENIWGDIEVIIDSPLAAKFTKVYAELEPYWDAEARGLVRRGRHPLSFEQLTTIDSHEDHLQTVRYLAKTARPTIVLAASGMCAGGRVVNYLKALIRDKRTDVLFVGYQAAGTPGRDIQNYGPRGGYVMLDGERYSIAAQVHTIGGYSAHADQKDLI